MTRPLGILDFIGRFDGLMPFCGAGPEIPRIAGQPSSSGTPSFTHVEDLCIMLEPIEIPGDFFSDITFASCW